MTLRFPNFRQHVKNRSMWKGSMSIGESEYWLLDNQTLQYSKSTICSEALLKCFDEIIINAADQIVRTSERQANKRSTALEVRYDTKTGEITIFNDGPGFDVYDDHPELPKGLWTVQAVITTERAGTNFDDMYASASADTKAGAGSSKTDTPQNDSVTGGINGLGIKLIVIDSVKFSIETVDPERNRYYYQEIHNGMADDSDIKPPIVVDLSGSSTLTSVQKKPHTTIKFIPDYKNLCRVSENVPNPKTFDEQDFKEFEKIIKFRTYQLCAFLTSLKYRYSKGKRIVYSKHAVYYNGSKLTCSTETILQLLGAEVCASTTLETPDEAIKFPWTISVGIKRDGAVKWGDAKQTNMSFLNGVYLSEGGSHVNFLNKQIYDYISGKLTKAEAEKITQNMFNKIVYIVDSIQMPVPAFKGQSKTQITIATKNLNEFKKTYVLPEAFLKKLAIKIKQEIKILIEDKKLDSKSQKQVKLRKYDKATDLGNAKYAGKRILCLPEGDSACKPVRDIIVDKKMSAYVGTYNLQGVPPSALKHIKKVIRGGVEHIVKDKTLSENVTFNGLLKILRLEYGQKEFDPKKMSYDSVLLCTDQDSDGIGQICSLVLVFFLVFFPDLVRKGFVKRLATPLIRVYTNNKAGDVWKFYSYRDFNKWIKDLYGDEINMPRQYTVKYYKGLATHTAEEVLCDIGENFYENIYTFTYDDACDTLMNLAYEKETGSRKEFLKTPVSMEYNESTYAKQIIKCSEHFGIESKNYQLEFIDRKLKSAIDGFIPVQRKAFTGGRKSDKVHKVYQITGKVAESLSYHHGDMSMNDTIIKMAQNFTGGSNIPLYMPISNGFGDRRTGRDDTGSARYIDTKLNKNIADAMFPPEDDWLLDYVFEDGAQAEPVHYVPVLPIAILETTTTVAVGWNINCWARDPKKVIENVKMMIELDWTPDSIFQPVGLLGNPWLKPGMRCVITQYGSGSKAASEVCLGEYTTDGSTVHITQLPLKIWSTPYKESLLGDEERPSKEYVADVIDNTGKDITDITIKLSPEGYEAIMNDESLGNNEIDAIEDYFGIKQQMLMGLNMTTAEKCVKEFKSYEEVISYWYPFRKNLYIQRLERMRILNEMKIDYWKNILRFINEDASKTIDIDKNFSDARRAEILETARYTKFNETVLFSPRYAKVADLRRLVYEVGADYNYIDKITIKDKSQTGILKIEERIKALEQDATHLANSKWQTIWLEEIDKVEKALARGIETSWLFDTKQHVFKKR